MPKVLFEQSELPDSTVNLSGSSLNFRWINYNSSATIKWGKKKTTTEKSSTTIVWGCFQFSVYIYIYIYIYKNQSVSGVTTICLMQCNTSPSHRVDQVVDCGLWNVGPLLFNGCAKLLDIDRNWNTLLYMPIQSIPNMLNGWHVRWVCQPCKNWDVFSFQELCTNPCSMGPCIIMLQHEVMVVD